jgi:ABC-2 type transport system ATP-binding protein
MSTVLRKLKREVFVLNLRDCLDELPDLDGFDVARVNDCEIEVAIDADRNLNQLFQELSARDISVLSLRNKANRLEELFMGLVEKKQIEPERAGQ